MHKRARLRSAVALSGAAILAISVLATTETASAAGDHSHRHIVPGTHQHWAISQNLVPSTTGAQVHGTVHLKVHLALRNSAAAEQLARAVSDPSNRHYQDYLSSSAFRARFSPTAKTVRRVRTYLRANGLHVGAVPANRRWISASGSVSEVQKAFHTTLHRYRVHGQVRRAAARPLSVPAALGDAVLSITGVTPSLRQPMSRQVQPAHPAPNAKLPKPRKCSTFYGQHRQRVPRAYHKRRFPTYICGYTGPQLRGAYDTSRLIRRGQDGRGTKVAIIDAYGLSTMRSDANRYFRDTGVKPFRRGQFQQRLFTPFNLKKQCGDWSSEEALDIEAVHNMAPGADVLYVGAKNCGAGIDNAMNWILNNFDDPQSKAYGVSIVSNSYGFIGESGENAPTMAEMRAENAMFIQAALEGVGLYFSSGDYGDNVAAGLLGSPQPDFPASSPYVTAVGGTSLAINRHDKYRFETGWGTQLDLVNIDENGKVHGYEEPLPGHFWAGAGGGTSTLFDQPWYQRGIVPNRLATSYDGTPNRVVPDVAMNADPYTGMLIGYTAAGASYTEGAIGGTSLACPLFAGLQALTQGRGKEIGFANPTLYALPSYAYHDVRAPRRPHGISNPSGTYLVTLSMDSSLSATRGFDNVTGRGSANGRAFVDSERAYLHR